MTTLHYELSSGQHRYWNLDWFLRVDFRREKKPDRFWVELTTAIPPGPKHPVDGISVARPFITLTLGDEEARQFASEYEKITCHDPRPRVRHQPRTDSSVRNAEYP